MIPLFRILVPALQTAKSRFNVHINIVRIWLAYPWFYTFSGCGHAVCSSTTRKGLNMLLAHFVDSYLWRRALFTPDLPANLQRAVEPRPVDHKVELGRRRARRAGVQSLPFESRRPFGPGPGALWL